jgi:hypothetical protein
MSADTLSKWLCLLLLSAQVLPASAYTDAEIDAMIKVLREENQSLKEQLRQLRNNSTANPPSLSEHIVTANANTAERTQVNDLKLGLKKQQQTFQIKGFLTAGATQSDPEISNQNLAFNDHISFDSDSIAGLQSRFIVSDNADLTLQLVARAADDWQLEAEWAFLRYQITDNLSFRSGRLRLPVYLFSESLEVGFSYPWVRPPTEVYSLPISNYEGIDLLYSTTLGDWTQQLQVFAGNDNDDDLQADRLFGGNLTLNSGPWTFRASASDFAFEIDTSEFSTVQRTEDDGGSYYTLAGMYDNGEWLLVSEISTFDSNQTNIFRDSDAGYITVAKYMGAWTPHLTFAKSYTTSEPEPYDLFGIPGISSELLTFTGTSYTTGLRYNLTASSSVKLEWTHYNKLDGTGGLWNNLRFGAIVPQTIDDIDIYSLVIDAVF